MRLPQDIDEAPKTARKNATETALRLFQKVVDQHGELSRMQLPR